MTAENASYRATLNTIVLIHGLWMTRRTRRQGAESVVNSKQLADTP
jgi:hypothetical protein